MSTSDRELLELAARAICLKPHISQSAMPGILMDDQTFWSPLEDDGDALRLAVKLNLDIRVGTLDGYIIVSVFGNYDNSPPLVEEAFDDYQGGLFATRRAIVRAAAEIGRSMK